ncbi:hypothetical protein, partial [Niabella yanshanensis]
MPRFSNNTALVCIVFPILFQISAIKSIKHKVPENPNFICEKSFWGSSDSGYLFTYFTGNSKEDEAIRFAISTDGYHFQALNNNQPVIASSAISATGGV